MSETSEIQESPERKEATENFIQARAALKNGDLNLAEQKLKRALALWPDNYNYVLQLAKVSTQLERPHREVEALLLQAGSINKTTSEPRILLATQYEKLGYPQRALSIYKGILNIEPNNLIVRRKLAQMELDTSNHLSFNAFLTALKSIAAQAPSETITQQPVPGQPPTPTSAENIFDQILEELSSNEEWNQLLDSIQQASSMMEVDGQMLLELGNNYLEVGLYSEALQEFQHAYEVFAQQQKNEQAALACRRIADTLLYMQMLREAAGWCEYGLSLTQEEELRLTFLDDLNRIYKELGEAEKAQEYESEIKSLSPEFAEPASLTIQFDEILRSVRYVLRPRRGIEGTDQPLLHTDYGEVSIGRLQTNDIVVPSPRVSKQHAKIRVTVSGIFITCLSQTNGTYLNGERLETGREYQIYPGDTIGLGRSIEFELVEKPVF